MFSCHCTCVMHPAIYCLFSCPFVGIDSLVNFLQRSLCAGMNHPDCHEKRNCHEQCYFDEVSLSGLMAVTPMLYACNQNMVLKAVKASYKGLNSMLVRPARSAAVHAASGKRRHVRSLEQAMLCSQASKYIVFGMLPALQNDAMQCTAAMTPTNASIIAELFPHGGVPLVFNYVRVRTHIWPAMGSLIDQFMTVGDLFSGDSRFLLSSLDFLTSLATTAQASGQDYSYKLQVRTADF